MRGKKVNHDRELAIELWDAGYRYVDGAGKDSRAAFIRRFRHRSRRSTKTCAVYEKGWPIR